MQARLNSNESCSVDNLTLFLHTQNITIETSLFDGKRIDAGQAFIAGFLKGGI
jgi:hypothetical protein